MKKTIAIILTFTLTISIFLNPVYASNNDQGFFRNTIEWVRKLCEIGMLMQYPNYPTIEEYMQQYKQEHPDSTIPVDGTEEDFTSWINNGTIVNGDNVSYNGDQWSFTKYFCEGMKEYYSYRVGYTLSASDYSDFVSYQQLVSIIGQYRNDYYIIIYNQARNIMCLPKDRTQFKYRSAGSQYGFYWDAFDTRSNSQIFSDGCVNFSNFVNTGSTTGQAYGFCLFQPTSPDNVPITGNAFLIDSVNTPIYVLDNFVDNTFNGIAPYYTTDSYNTNTQTDSHNTTITKIDNSVTYGNTNSYVIEYYRENQEYPSPQDINIYIEMRQPEDNPSGGGGSGSGNNGTGNISIINNNNPTINIGSGTVSGNGSGGSGSGGIFDWLNGIGQLIGDLISGIGQALVGILEGVTSAVTSVVEGIPNVLAPLISFIFEGLPEEITALMTLGITSVLLIAIVKAIRK